jgi:hypothetical protein
VCCVTRRDRCGCEWRNKRAASVLIDFWDLGLGLGIYLRYIIITNIGKLYKMDQKSTGPRKIIVVPECKISATPRSDSVDGYIRKVGSELTRLIDEVSVLKGRIVSEADRASAELQNRIIDDFESISLGLNEVRSNMAAIKMEFAELHDELQNALLAMANDMGEKLTLRLASVNTSIAALETRMSIIEETAARADKASVEWSKMAGLNNSNDTANAIQSIQSIQSVECDGAVQVVKERSRSARARRLEELCERKRAKVVGVAKEVNVEAFAERPSKSCVIPRAVQDECKPH